MPNNVWAFAQKKVLKIFKKIIKKSTKKSITKRVNIKNPTVIADMMKLVKEGELRYNMAGFTL